MLSRSGISMRSNARNSLCPSRFCFAHDPVQTLVSKVQADQVNEPALGGAILCSACGCVWVRDDIGGAHVLGTLRKSGLTHEWISAYKPPQPAS